MAQLKLGIQHKCGGALISEQHVLTSVNCVDEMVKNRKNSEKITVVLNSRFFNSYKGDVYDVIDIRTYPRFLKGPENSEHDIAIVYVSHSSFFLFMFFMILNNDEMVLVER